MSETLYQATLYHLTLDGHVISVFPFVGPGPYDFCPVYLSAASTLLSVEQRENFGDGGWYLMTKDGLGGICCLDMAGVDVR